MAKKKQEPVVQTGSKQFSVRVSVNGINVRIFVSADTADEALEKAKSLTTYTIV